jgi:uncharacterized protein (DUF433 family)
MTVTIFEDKDLTLYGGQDPRLAPLYTYPEAARATGIPASTLRAWTVGQTYRRKNDRGYFEPVIGRPSHDDARLSFTNLIEAHVLRALRTVHEVKLSAIREAVDIAEREFGITRLMVSPDLRASPGQLFLDRYTHFLELSAAQQLAMKSILDQFLERVVFDASRLPAEFFPFERSPRNSGQRLIAISPYISFGSAVIQRVGVSTHAVVQRIELGEPADLVIADYGLTGAELEEAILYEAAA